MTYTMENLEAEINKLLESYENLINDNLLQIQFINNGEKTQFIISLIKHSLFIAINSKYSIISFLKCSSTIDWGNDILLLYV